MKVDIDKLQAALKKKKQAEAMSILAEILGRIPQGFSKCTGDIQTCPIDECMLCSVRDCPGHEPLHYHHDGCPYCWQKEEV